MARLGKFMLSRRWGTTLAAAGVLLTGWTQSAQAIPALQIYIEGATYDSATESWTYVAPDSSAGQPFRIWTIGQIGPQGGNNGAIHDVRLAASYSASLGDIQIQLTPSTTGGLGGFTDPSTPGDPMTGLNDAFYTSADSVYAEEIANGDGRYENGIYYGGAGTLPNLSDGTDLPKHGEFGAGVAWQEFYLGDFDDPDSPGADFINSFPEPSDKNTAQINVYDVIILAADGGSAHGITVHFDLYDSIQAGNKAKFAPFSHDAHIIPAPSPGLAAATLLGVLAIGVTHRRRREAEVEALTATQTAEV